MYRPFFSPGLTSDSAITTRHSVIWRKRVTGALLVGKPEKVERVDVPGRGPELLLQAADETRRALARRESGLELLRRPGRRRRQGRARRAVQNAAEEEGGGGDSRRRRCHCESPPHHGFWWMRLRPSHGEARNGK